MNPAWIRRGAAALAAARVAIGVGAMVSPALIARPWVGDAAHEPAGKVLGRALGGRDLALGAGALAALLGAAPAGGAGTWVGLAALADSCDVLATAAHWGELPTVTRWLVLGSAAGAAVTGGVAAWALGKEAPGNGAPGAGGVGGGALDGGDAADAA